MESRDSKQMLQVGTKLQDGKYVIKKQLSSGGFGNTYIVVDKQFEDEFALKEFFIKGINDRQDDSTNVSISNAANTKLFKSQKEKFKKEARRLRKLNNKHIVRVYDLFEENDTAYYVMDFITGESLSSRIKTTGVPLSENEALRILDQILDALEEVHNLKIWHLDLKPGNILVNDKGNAVLIDFGASKQISSSEGYETTTSSMCYTPGYAPSEQVDQNMDRIGPWTDLYALGATLYNLLTCTAPPTVSEIQEGNAFKFPSSVSVKTREMIEWMMTPARIKRPQSVADVRHYLLLNKPSEGYEDDEITILDDMDDKTVVGRNNNIPQKPKDFKPPLDESDSPNYESQSGRESNSIMWKIVGVVAAVIIAYFLLSLSGNKAGVASEWLVDSDSIAVVDSIEVDTVAADSVLADTVAAVW